MQSCSQPQQYLYRLIACYRDEIAEFESFQRASDFQGIFRKNFFAHGRTSYRRGAEIVGFLMTGAMCSISRESIQGESCNGTSHKIFTVRKSLLGQHCTLSEGIFIVNGIFNNKLLIKYR